MPEVGYLADLGIMREFQQLARTAFGWNRVAEPTTLFDQPGFRYGKTPILWEDIAVGDGLSTHNSDAGVITLSTGGTATFDSMARQTYQHFHYQPGKGGLFLSSFVLGPKINNIRRRVGQFETYAGFYLEEINGELWFTQRSSATGSTLNDRVPMDEWDRRIDFDQEKTMLMAVAYEWLGVGRSIWMLADPHTSEFALCHTKHNVNRLPLPYMETAVLPVRYEVEAIGEADEIGTLTQICSVVISEGGFETGRGIPQSWGNKAVPISVTTRRPICSIRPSATFNGKINRIDIEPVNVDLTASTNTAYWELVWGGTLTGASCGTVNSESGVEGDVAASSISGGITIAHGYVSPGGGVTRGTVAEDLASRLPITLDAAGANPRNLSLVCTSLTGTSSVAGGINWKEIR